MSQINVLYFTIEIFKTYFTCHYCPEAIMKTFVQLTCIIIGLKVIFTNSIFKSYTVIAMGIHALKKWSHYKVKLLQNSIISALIILPSYIVPTSQTRSVLRPRAILPRTDSVVVVLLRNVLTIRENIVE